MLALHDDKLLCVVLLWSVCELRLNDQSNTHLRCSQQLQLPEIDVHLGSGDFHSLWAIDKRWGHGPEMWTLQHLCVFHYCLLFSAIYCNTCIIYIVMYMSIELASRSKTLEKSEQMIPYRAPISSSLSFQWLVASTFLSSLGKHCSLILNPFTRGVF